MTAESNNRLVILNPATGAETRVGPSGQGDISLGVFLGGRVLGTNGGGLGPQLVSVNPITGAGTPGPLTNEIYLIASVPTPEPGTIGLIAAGAVAMGLWKRRRSWQA